MEIPTPTNECYWDNKKRYYGKYHKCWPSGLPVLAKNILIGALLKLVIHFQLKKGYSYIYSIENNKCLLKRQYIGIKGLAVKYINWLLDLET